MTENTATKTVAKSEPIIDEEFGLYKERLRNWASEFPGTVSFEPGPKARDGNGLSGHGGDWLHITIKVDGKTSYSHRIAHLPKTENELDGVLSEASDVFRYNLDRRKSEEEAAVSNAEAALAGLSPEQISAIMSRLKS